MTQALQDIKALSLSELQNFVKEIGETEFRAGQIFGWIHGKGVSDFSSMTNLSASLKEKLSQHFYFSSIETVTDTHSIEAQANETVKFLFRLPDGKEIESVLIPNDRNENRLRLTVCVSSQVGCALGCKFCATGYMGFFRNLTIGEIVDQVALVGDWAMSKFGKKITNVVFMGMGEPMLNYDRCKEAMDILSDDRYRFQIPKRRITVSTVGIVPGILRMADDGVKFKLAVSLHSASDVIRQEMMPIAQEFPLVELKKALKYYHQKTKRPTSFEYLLIDGKTDSEQAAEELIRFCNGLVCKINLIDYNPIVNIKYRSSFAGEKERFVERLVRAGLTVTIRKSRGKDINAACGQLAIKSVSGKRVKLVKP
ncbi:MAG: 23S rRNA (adenine(2503)-C(2))-methyltransferase RlmN [Chlorobiales bacterium]|jgi:23S rRNA (adenine2503-C2)-methyltransferase|nr:23S rRNA (adenine(2503)-C(2))-methyltransferase RlmN [Chlorobiales bacterium]